MKLKPSIIQYNNLGKLDIFLNFELLQNLSCNDIINLVKTSKNNLNIINRFSKNMWFILIDNIKIDGYNKYGMKSPRGLVNYPDLDNNYLIGPNNNHQYKTLINSRLCNNKNKIYCRLFFTKCLHKHLLDKYKKNLEYCRYESMKQRNLVEYWHESIRQNNINDYKYFNYLIDTTVIEKYAFRFNNLISVIIPDSVIHIDNYAFEYNELTSITLPKYIKSIGEGAFLSNKLIYVSIPESIEIIYPNAFDKHIDIGYSRRWS